MIQQETGVDVRAQGELVVLAFGNVRYSIEFVLALRIAAALKFNARLAKLCSGDDSRRFSCAGVLTDANAERLRRKRFGQRLPELLRAHDVDVSHEGQLVTLRFGRATRKMAHRDASTLSQWLRVRGKEAKANAGERAHWSDLVPRDSGLRV